MTLMSWQSPPHSGELDAKAYLFPVFSRRILNTAAFLTAFLALPIDLKAESCQMVEDTAGVPSPALIYGDKIYLIEPAFEDYSFMLFDACDAWGISISSGCDIYPMMGAIEWNAIAAICDGNKVIVYDRRISPNIGYEGAQAVIAHELAHHVCNHIVEGPQSDEEARQNELEADRFSGATMRLLGFSMERALAYVPLLMEQPSKSHPGRPERETEILAGWNDPQSGVACLSE